MIKIRDLSFTIKNKKILNNINISFPNNGMIFITGESGSGKTTLLKCIEGLLNYNGSILYNEKEVKNNKNLLRKDIFGIVTQNLNIIDDLTCYDNLKMALDITGIKENQDHIIRKYLEKVRLSKYKNSLAGLLSGGEKQRLAIARAVCKDPNVLLCDEVTSALDKENKEIILKLLKELSRDKLVIITSHDREIVDEYADGILKITSGVVDCFKEFNSIDKLEILERKNKVSVLKIKLFSKPIKYLLLSISFVILALSMAIGVSIYTDDNNDYKYDDEISIVTNQDNEILAGSYELFNLISKNGGVITSKPYYLKDFYFSYGTYLDLNIIENISNDVYAQMYVDQIDYKLVCGETITNYNEIIIDKILADKIITILGIYGYKNFHYSEIINDMSLKYNNLTFKIKGISNINFNGIYMDKGIFSSLVNYRMSTYYSAESKLIKYYNKNSYNKSLNKISDIRNDKINIYTNTQVALFDSQFNVIGSIYNPVSDCDVVFESTDDYDKFILKCFNITSSIDKSMLHFKTLTDDIEIVSGNIPNKENEILLPYYFEDLINGDSVIKSRFKFLNDFEVSGYYKLQYDIKFSDYSLIYINAASYANMFNNSSFNDFFVYDLNDFSQYKVINYNQYLNSLPVNNFSLTIVLYVLFLGFMVGICIFIIFNIVKNQKVYSTMRLLGVGRKKILMHSIYSINKLFLYFFIPQIVSYIVLLIFKLNDYLYEGIFIIQVLSLVILNVVNLISHIILLSKPINSELKKNI
ncbi:MAG: ATP-binding cassette domain-containing protein [Anaeroplasmataceae bacterium]